VDAGDALMTPLNEHCFHQPHWLVIARGFKVEDWFEDDQGVGSGGIENPQAVDLPVGQRYYRFAGSTSSKAAQVGGGWWIDYEAFHTIDTFAQQNNINLSTAARLFLALPYEWTRVDRLVSAILEVPLRAYAGRGKPALGDLARPDTTWTPMQHRPVIQFYIPGLYVKRQKPTQEPQLYESAFPQPKFEYILGTRREV
jgi:hypothetical protein